MAINFILLTSITLISKLKKTKNYKKKCNTNQGFHEINMT